MSARIHFQADELTCLWALISEALEGGMSEDATDDEREVQNRVVAKIYDARRRSARKPRGAAADVREGT